jgi:hypothetical protein
MSTPPNRTNDTVIGALFKSGSGGKYILRVLHYILPIQIELAVAFYVHIMLRIHPHGKVKVAAHRLSTVL